MLLRMGELLRFPLPLPFISYPSFYLLPLPLSLTPPFISYPSLYPSGNLRLQTPLDLLDPYPSILYPLTFSLIAVLSLTGGKKVWRAGWRLVRRAERRDGCGHFKQTLNSQKIIELIELIELIQFISVKRRKKREEKRRKKEEKKAS